MITASPEGLVPRAIFRPRGCYAVYPIPAGRIWLDDGLAVKAKQSHDLPHPVTLIWTGTDPCVSTPPNPLHGLTGFPHIQ